MSWPCPHLLLLDNWNSVPRKGMNSFHYQHIQTKLSPYICDKKCYKLKVKRIQLHNTIFTWSQEFNLLRITFCKCNFYRCLHPVVYITVIKLCLPSTHTVVVYYPVFYTTCFNLSESSSGVLHISHYCCIVRSVTFSCPKLLLVCGPILCTLNPIIKILKYFKNISGKTVVKLRLKFVSWIYLRVVGRTTFTFPSVLLVVRLWTHNAAIVWYM
jgi:hypothetical protein